MIKRTFLVSMLTIVLLAGTIISGACTTPTPTPTPTPAPTLTPAKPIELIFSTWTPPPSADSTLCKDWMKQVEDASKGRVKFTFQDGGALGGPREHYDLAVSGQADIVFFNFASVLGRFTLMDLMQVPFVIPSADAGSYALWKMYKEFPEIQQQMKDVKVIGLAVNDPTYPFTTKKAGPIRTMADFKGKKLRASGPEAATLEALGATPIAMIDMAEVYVALEKGVLDGAVYGMQALLSFKYFQVGHYSTSWEGSSIRALPFGLFMNQNKWNSLPADIQKIMVNDFGIEGNWFHAMAAATHTRAAAAGVKTSKDNGWEFYTLPADELAKWEAAATPARNKMIADIEAKGLPGKKFVDRLEQLCKEYKP